MDDLRQAREETERLSLAVYMSHTGNSWKEKLPVCLPSSPSSGNVGSVGSHVQRVEDRRISIDILSGRVASDKRATNPQQLRYRDVVKRDMKGLEINAELDTSVILSLARDFCFRRIVFIYFWSLEKHVK